MTEKEEAGRKYLVQEEKTGIYVSDTGTQQRFFKVGGQWFWFAGEGNPFDEDVIVPPETAGYLSRIVEEAQKLKP